MAVIAAEQVAVRWAARTGEKKSTHLMPDMLYYPPYYKKLNVIDPCFLLLRATFLCKNFCLRQILFNLRIIYLFFNPGHDNNQWWCDIGGDQSSIHYQ